MTQQTINLGVGPNTATGDPIRIAFGKINSNFTEIYTQGFHPFTPTSAGLVPASGGGTVNFLRADGTWAPAGLVASVSTTDAALTISPTTGAVVVANNDFTSVAHGTVPASGGGTANFLRADGTWAPATTAPAVPGTIPDLWLWWESDNILASTGTQINSLLNRNPFSNAGTFVPAAQATSTGVKVSASPLNGLTAVTFNGTTSTFSFQTGVQPVFTLGTIFIVIKPNSLAAIGYILGVSGGSGLVLRIETTGKLDILQENVTAIGSSTAALSVGTWYQANITWTQGASGPWAWRVARAASGSGTTNFTITQPPTAIGYAPFTGSFYLNADMAAIIMYQRVLSGAEITSVENYLHTKWGV